MTTQCIDFVLLVTVMQHSTGKRCQLKTESGEVTLVCCADSEAKGNDCIACSKGYTSIIGQNCLPCTRKTYGERCKFECHCSDFEICSHVDGCVELSITAGTSVDKTSYITTLPWNVAARTTGDNTDNSDEATVHRMESSLPDNEIVTIREHEYTFQYPIQLMKDFIGWPYEYKTSSNIPENTVPKRIISKARGMKSLSCNNLDIKRLKSEIYSGANGKHMNSNDNRLDFNNILKTKSERDIGS
ncbi:unnamed protein product [Mytilus coruscus]|uniref:MEGF10_11 n=1 Tax=Mytilus coruscus TaxID=42192 RepID=A0A6J8BWQ7_MYTCO|nr:unnamed protein product [Mytilus coruscus]